MFGIELIISNGQKRAPQNFCCELKGNSLLKYIFHIFEHLPHFLKSLKDIMLFHSKQQIIIFSRRCNLLCLTAVGIIFLTYIHSYWKIYFGKTFLWFYSTCVPQVHDMLMQPVRYVPYINPKLTYLKPAVSKAW